MFDQNVEPKKDDAAPAPAWEDLLKQVTREDGSQKYSTPEDLVKGTIHAQNHIKTLEQELRQKEEELKAIIEKREKTAVEKALERDGDDKQTPAVVGLTEKDVLALLTQVESKKQQDANVAQVRQALVAEAGSEEAAAKLFAEKAAASGLDTGTLTALAAKSPEAAKRLLGLNGKQTAPEKQVRGTITPSGMPKAAPERKRILLGGATSRDMTEAWNRHKPS